MEWNFVLFFLIGLVSSFDPFSGSFKKWELPQTWKGSIAEGDTQTTIGFIKHKETNEFLCFGTFVTKSYLLTTASCLKSQSESSVEVQYDELYNNGREVLNVPAKKLIIHPYYSPREGWVDIALVQIMIIAVSAKPLALPSNATLTLNNVTTLRWEEDSDPKSIRINRTMNHYINRMECIGLLDRYVDCSEICIVGRTIPNTRSNLGSPLIIETNEKKNESEKNIVGIYTNNGGLANIAAVYQDIRPFAFWINKQIFSE